MSLLLTAHWSLVMGSGRSGRSDCSEMLKKTTDRHNLANEQKFMIDFGRFVDSKLKFVASELPRTFHELSSSSWQFMNGHISSQTVSL